MTTPTEEIRQLRARLAELERTARPPITRDQIKKMTPEEINLAHDAGELDELLGKPPRRPIRTLADVRGMTPAEINERWDEIAPLLGAAPAREGGDE